MIIRHWRVTVHSNIVLKEEAVFEDGFVAFGSNVLYGSTEIKELNVTDSVVLKSDVLIEGNIRLNSNITIDGDFQSSGDFQVHGHLKVNDSFEITPNSNVLTVSYTHLRAHETKANLVCRLLLEKKKPRTTIAPP